MKKYTVSVIVPNRNGEKYIANCIKSILKEKEGNYEIVIVDDGSIDTSIKKIKPFTKYENVSLIQLDKPGGVAKARNIAVKQSSGDCLLFLDLDTEITPGWFENTVSFFKRNKKAGIGLVKLLIAGTKHFDSTGELISSFGLLVERCNREEDQGQFDREEFVFSGKTAGMIVRREVFKFLGGFDEDYEIYMEDTDLCWRCWLSGYHVMYTPFIVVSHAYGTKPKSYYRFHKIYYRGSKNTILMHVKNLGITRLIFVLPIQYFIWITLLISTTLKGDRKKAHALFSGITTSMALIPKTLSKRAQVQSTRKCSDKKLFTIVGTHRPLSYFLTKAQIYVNN